MKIAFLSIYQNKVNRGNEIFVHEIAKRLSKSNEVTVISGDGQSQKHWSFLWRLFLDPEGIYVLVFTLKNVIRISKGKFDVIIPTNGGWQTLIVKIYCLLTGRKLVVSGQSGIGWHDRVNLFLSPNAFVALSSKAKSWAEKAKPRVRTIYIPNGVDLTFFSNNKKIKKKKSVLCVGALVREKRVDLVIKAVSKVPDINLIVVGEGSLKNELVSLAKNLLPERHKFISVSHDRMPEIYHSADLFTLVPQKSEAFGIVYVEALASGLPVVAIDDQTRREIIGDAGLFVKNPEDTEEFSNKIKRALGTKWGNKPHKQAEKFDWDNIAGQYEQLFKKL